MAPLKGLNPPLPVGAAVKSAIGSRRRGQVVTLTMEEPPLPVTWLGRCDSRLPDGVSHVTARGNERKAIVRVDTDRARCDAWVLMDTH